MDLSPFGKIIAIVLVAVMIFLFPLPYLAKAVNETVDDLVNKYATEFSYAARQQGKITKNMYDNMVRELERTGELYEVNIEVSHPVSGIEEEEIELGDRMPEEGVYRVSYAEDKITGTEILEGGLLNSQDHEDEIKSFAAHTHTNDCYVGHRHSGSCNQFSATVYAEEDRRSDGRGYTGIYVRCPNCGGDLNIFSRYTNDPDYVDCIITNSRLSGAFNRVNYEYHNPAPYYQANDKFNALFNLIKQYTTRAQYTVYNFRYYGTLPSTAYTSELMFGFPTTHCIYCNKSAYQSCGQVQDETPICSQVVTSITATSPVQTISTKEEFVSTANVTYLDSHTGVVNCSNNLNINAEGDQVVTLTYSGLVGNAKTTGTITCIVNTNVKPLFKLASITVSPASQEVTRYQSPSLSVIANYDNGTSKQVTDYSISYYNSSILGTQKVTITYTESSETKTATVNVIVRNLTIVCPVCYTSYYLDNNDTDQGCPNCNSTIESISASPDSIVINKGMPLNITVEATYRNGKHSIVTGWTSNYDSSQVGIQDVTITYQTFTAVVLVEVRNQQKTCSICSQEYELNNDGTDPGCSVCKKTVVSIEVSPKILTINKHQSLPITIKATFRDGHTENINDWASNLTADTAGIYEVMILYQNVMDTITVTVIEDGQIECPYCGLKYLFNYSPKGCPSCYVTLTGIEASLRGGGTKVPYKSKLNLQIIKIFKDEHRELTYTGWTVSGYNPSLLGSQTITAHYNGFSDQLDIEVVDDLPEVTCPNGHTYYLNADGSDPGCPYCNGTRGEAESLFYFDTTYTGFIIDAIYTNGEYPLKQGDYLKITIKPRHVSILSKLLKMFSGIIKTEYTFGGEVS